MSRNKLITLRRLAFALILGTSVLGAMPVAAESEHEKAERDRAARMRPAGSWAGTVTAVNPPIGQFANLLTLIPGGGVIESRRLYVRETPFGALLETPGHGAWRRVGPNTLQINFLFLLQGAPDNPALAGNPFGTDNISIRAELDHSGKLLTGTFRSDVKDLGGNIIFTTTGTYSASRIEAAH